MSEIRGLEFRNRDEAPCRADQVAGCGVDLCFVAAILAFGDVETGHRHHRVIMH